MMGGRRLTRSLIWFRPNFRDHPDYGYRNGHDLAAGNWPAADDQGNVYVMTGNGHFQSTQGLLPDYEFIRQASK